MPNFCWYIENYRLTFKQLKSKANFVVRLLGDWNVKNEEICRGSFLSGINWLYPSLFKARIPKKGNIAQKKKYFSRFLYLKRLQSDRLTKLDFMLVLVKSNIAC